MHYLIAQITIDDRETYAQYEAGFMEIFSSYGGRMLAVDEAANLLEGEWPFTRTVVAEFPDEQQALAFYHSEAYQTLAQFRFAASSGNVVLIKGLS